MLWRRANLADVEQITRAQKAMDAVDHPDWTTPASDIEDELGLEHVDLATDSAVGCDAAGRVVAWGLVEASPTAHDRHQARLHGGVVPQRRGQGIGSDLLAWQVARGREQVAALEPALPGWVRTSVEERNPAAMAVCERAGMRQERWFTWMERDLLGSGARSVDPVVMPDGVRLVTYTSDRAEDARLARDDAFRDHWGFRPSAPQIWQQFVAGELFRADLSFLALDPSGRILGFALANANPEDWPLQGYTSSYLGLLGVIREGRRRGIATALLNAYLAATRDGGLERAVLDVDSANPSGALGLYEAVGFTTGGRSVEYVLDLPRLDRAGQDRASVPR